MTALPGLLALLILALIAIAYIGCKIGLRP